MAVWDQLEPLRSTVKGDYRTRSKARQGRLRWPSLRLLAPLGGLALAGLAAFPVLAPPSATTYATGLGEVRSVVLPDGSIAWLNTDSRLTVAISPFSRALRLERGEGEFKVAHEAWRAFIVSTANAEVRATGTEFSVRAGSDGSRVVLLQGRVQVRRPRDGEVADLKAGTVLLAPTTGAFQFSRADPDADIAWRRGLLVFYERPIAEVVREFARYTGIKVRFADAASGARRISGTFRATDFKAFLNDIAKLYNIHSSTNENNEIVIRSAA